MQAGQGVGDHQLAELLVDFLDFRGLAGDGAAVLVIRHFAVIAEKGEQDGDDAQHGGVEVIAGVVDRRALKGGEKQEKDEMVNRKKNQRLPGAEVDKDRHRDNGRHIDGNVFRNPLIEQGDAGAPQAEKQAVGKTGAVIGASATGRIPPHRQEYSQSGQRCQQQRQIQGKIRQIDP